MNFILMRNRTFATLSGHSIAFKKGEPTYVPPEAHKEVIGIGAVPEEDIEEPEAPVSKEITDPAERQKAIFDAFDNIVLRARREDFAASGVPSQKAIEAELGWPLAHQKERATLWEQYKAEKGAE